jgi:glycosyltransferase involved in cell wall biosynthesis
MRIIIVVGSYNLGGAEFHAFKLAKYFKNKGYTIEFWVFRTGDNTSRLLCKEAGVDTKVITEFNSFLPGVKGFLQRRHYKKIIKGYNPDVIISFNFVNNVWNGIIGNLAKVPVTIWSQQSEFKEDWDFNLASKAVENSTCFISNAQHVSLKLKNAIPVHRNTNDFHIVYNGIEEVVAKNTECFWMNKIQADRFGVIVTMVANLTKTKDHETLLKAWKGVLNLNTENKSPLLVLAGRKGETTENIESLVKELELGYSVIILGSTNDVTGLNKISDIGVLSSKAEGLPNSVMEQMAAGLPIVGTGNDGTREAVGEDMWQYLSPIGDVQSLTNKLSNFINNKNLRREVGVLNKNRIDSHFSVEKMGEDTIRIIRKYL